MLELAALVVGAALTYLAREREQASLLRRVERAEAHADHLQKLLAYREAPTEQAQYMADLSEPPPPLVPENALWDDEGLFWTTPDESE